MDPPPKSSSQELFDTAVSSLATVKYLLFNKFQFRGIISITDAKSFIGLVNVLFLGVENSKQSYGKRHKNRRTRDTEGK